MNRECPVCGLPYYREPGYFVGAMIFNYIGTIFTVIVAYLISLLLPPIWRAAPERKIMVWLIASVCLSLALVPWTRSLWIAIDFWIGPWSVTERS